MYCGNKGRTEIAVGGWFVQLESRKPSIPSDGKFNLGTQMRPAANFWAGYMLHSWSIDSIQKEDYCLVLSL
jgi:hypothetical protein